MNNLLHLFLAIVLLPSGSFAGLQPSSKKIEIARTVDVDKMVIGVTNDLKMIAFDCERTSFFQKSPVAVVETTNNRITFKESSYDGVRLATVTTGLSKAFPLSDRAAEIICSSENQQPVTLQVIQSQLDLSETD